MCREQLAHRKHSKKWRPSPAASQMKPSGNSSENIRSKAALPRDADWSKMQSLCLTQWPAWGQCKNCRGNMATVDAVARPSLHWSIYWQHEHPFRQHLQALCTAQILQQCHEDWSCLQGEESIEKTCIQISAIPHGRPRRVAGTESTCKNTGGQGPINGERLMTKHTEKMCGRRPAKGVKCSHVEIRGRGLQQRRWSMRTQARENGKWKEDSRCRAVMRGLKARSLDFAP